MSAFRGHVSDLEIPITEGVEVTDIGKEEGLFVIRTDSDKVFRTKTLLLATGSEPRRLGIKGEKEFAGKGVAYCAICDAPFFKNRDVIIAGGGNSAVEAAIDLAKVATSVTIVHRSKFRADQILVDQLYTNEKITVHLETQIEEILGEQFMTSIQVLDKHTGEKRIIQADGIFIEIGNLPNSGLFKDLVALNDQGEVIVNYKNETSVPGIFAAGDVTDGPYKQIIIATSEGAKAALSASEYINKQPINRQ
jgi:alkyl hydroperoxide reductase subunit F